MNLPLFIAKRYMTKQKGTFSSFVIRLAVVSTAFSVAVMIVALGVVTGFKYAISEKLYSFIGHAQVRTFNETGAQTAGVFEPIHADLKMQQTIAQLPHVVSVSPYIIRPVIVQAKGLLEGMQMMGIDSTYKPGKGVSNTGQGINYKDSSYAKEITLSKTTADRLNVQVGDTVQINFVDQGLPRIRRLRVTGLYHSGMEEIDKYFALCDIRLLQRINAWPADSINGYHVMLDDAAYADTVATLIHYNAIVPPLAVYTTGETYSFIFDWLQLQGVSSTILIVIMSVVAVINLAAALLILIVDRAVMIGLLTALGMPATSVRGIFLAIAGIIGTTGVLVGNVLGLGLCWVQYKYGLLKLPEDTYYVRYAPIKLIPWQVIAVDVATLGLCVLCMWLPSLYIRKIQPAKVLQFK
jgi:lipoprotein-releasing system permease protein